MRHFAHALPFGASLTPEGRVRFRLWAPAADSVSLALADPDRTMALNAAGDGWFECVTAAAEPGTRYGFVLPDGTRVPDPAARAQEKGTDGYSIVVDPRRYDWLNPEWRGRPWQDTVFYELHVGTFTPEGTYAATRRRLPFLAELGITAVELMPLASFGGLRNWGYDGVLPFAPDSSYGTIDELKALIDAAHGLDLMMFLDVVYNHFGPEGNYLDRYAPQFFTDSFNTPWGRAIDFAQRPVRDFFIHNALYWLEEFRFDGLRLDAAHAIYDESALSILEELATTVREKVRDRPVHLVLEDDKNRTHLLKRDGKGAPSHYNAQWNDDFHHAVHVLLIKESGGYYADYIEDTPRKLGRALAEGFVYQGEPSPFRGGMARGETTRGLPPDAFVSFLQNHDQIGNRAFGERLSALTTPDARAVLRAIHLLSPQIPLIFMGEEWNAATPFRFFCDFEGALGEAVRRGRWQEFARFPEFADEARRAAIPDPTAQETFLASKLDWRAAAEPAPATTRGLLALRKQFVVPLLYSGFEAASATGTADGFLQVEWRFAAGTLFLIANLSDLPSAKTAPGPGAVIFSTHKDVGNSFPPWFARVSRDTPRK